MFVFGYSQYGQVGLGDRVDVCEPSHVRILDDRQVPYTVVQVACGRYHTLALTSTGEVFSWGGGKNGRLGHGDEKIRTLPTKVMAFQTSVFSIACGYHSSVAITADGVYSWGWGAHGQLGHGDANDRFSPHRIESLTAVSPIPDLSSPLQITHLLIFTNFPHRKRRMHIPEGFSPRLYFYLSSFVLLARTTARLFSLLFARFPFFRSCHG